MVGWKFLVWAPAFPGVCVQYSPMGSSTVVTLSRCVYSNEVIVELMHCVSFVFLCRAFYVFDHVFIAGEDCCWQKRVLGRD